MGKGKKKGSGSQGKGSTKEVEDLQSLSLSEEPETTEAEPTEEAGEGLTGAAKRKKKKEQKRAEKEARKGDATDVKELQAVAEAPVSAPPEPEPEKPAEEIEGLGLAVEKKKKSSRRKKGDASKAEAPTPAPAAQVEAPASAAQVEAPASAAQVQAPATWSRSAPVASAVLSPDAATKPWSGEAPQSAYRPSLTQLPMEVGSPAGPPPPSSWSRRSGPPPASQPPQGGDYARAGPSQAPSVAQSSTSIPAQPANREVTPRPEMHPRTTKMEVSCRFKIPKKIEGNTVPIKRINVLTNYLPMTIKDLRIYRYDVTFKPDRPKKMLAKAFKLAQDKLFRNNIIAFDQIKNCYALNELKGVTLSDRVGTTVEIKDQNDKILSFEVSFKGTGTVDLSTITQYMKTGGTSLSPPTEAIQCIDVILRQGTLESYVKAGRQFFKRPAKPIDLGDGLEMWTGLFQSGIFTSRAFVNIDVAHKGFPRQQPLVKALQDFRLDPNRPLDVQRGRGNESFMNFIKGLRVVASVGGDSSSSGMRREFICNGLVGTADSETFCYENPNGKKEMMSVTQYFMRVKGVRLRYPHLNCVWVGPREKTIFYPMELLEVSYGQAQNKQLNEMQLATMVRQAATPPDERKKKIEEVIVNMNYSRNNYFKKFGLEISDKFFEVEAKMLKPPVLEVGESTGPIMPRRGVWQSNKVYKAEALQSWGFIAIEADPNRCDFQKTISMIMSVGRSMGMAVSEPQMNRCDVSIRNLQSVLFTALQKHIKFLFVIVSARGRDYYHRVKQMAERDVGILTQCIKEYTAQNRMNNQTVRNILLKVNSKLMGVNQVLSMTCVPRCIKEGGVMVVGADVTHPSPDQSNIPSIAAVIASIDSKCFLYNSELSIQTPKKEMIVEFEEMMVDHLKVYRDYQKCLPKKIFVFRDGVSEGQFAHVMNSELQAVHNAYRTMGGPNAKPEVLFLLVQKRHHTRLFLPNSSQNVEPGTVVDKHIVHASELDFYLVSHQAIKGTARPTRYHAVCNDGGIPHDEVEQLTYYLCHLYARCMRAVSYPTPTYYAHLACLRARSLTHGEKFDNKELERHPKRLRVMDKILQISRMFFV